MKRCPQCTKTYDDELDYCFDDGTPLRLLEADIPTVAFAAPISMPTAISNRREPGKFVFVALGALGALVMGLGVLVYSMYVSNDESQNKAAANANAEPNREPTPKTVSNAKTSETPSTVETPPTVSTEDTKQLVQKWSTAQNERSTPLYRSCYAPTLVAVKRTPKSERRYSYATWMTDRAKMMPKIVEVRIESPTYSMDGDTAVARFVQHWRSVNYCDIGDKELRIKMFPDGPKIVFETISNVRGC